MDIQNGNGKIYFARHMHGGVGGYETETVLVDTEAVKAMLPSFVGKNVYIDHQEFGEPDPRKADGYVTDSFYNAYDSWAWVKMIIIDPDAQKAIDQKGWSVSNAYSATQFGPGGTKTNVPYDREILNGEFDHLAIVPNPRYENACVMTSAQYQKYNEEQKAAFQNFHNSKPTKGATMFSFFKNARQEVETPDADTMVEIKNNKGAVQEVRFQDMVDAFLNKKNASEDKDDKDEKDNKKINEDTMVMVGDEEMRMGDLIAFYGKETALENTKDDDKENAEDEETEAEREARLKKEAEDKANKKKNFNELRNANTRAIETTQVINSVSDQVARGRDLF